MEVIARMIVSKKRHKIFLSQASTRRKLKPTALILTLKRSPLLPLS